MKCCCDCVYVICDDVDVGLRLCLCVIVEMVCVDDIIVDVKCGNYCLC